MLNVYKNMSRQQQADRVDQYTGHDRFVQVDRSLGTRRRKKTIPLGPRRAQSASEFNARALREARARASLFRSASQDDRGGDERRSGSVSSLTRLFSCVSVAAVNKTRGSQRRRPPGPGAAPRYICGIITNIVQFEQFPPPPGPVGTRQVLTRPGNQGSIEV